MGTETRIGIATGLVIVVVASVYFFYGSDRSEDDLLMVSGARLNEVPAVPPSTATRDPGNRPAVQARSPSNSARKTVGRHRAVPPANKSRGRRVDTAARPAPGRPATTGGTRVAAARRKPPTQLRSEPSSILIDATKKNLKQSPAGPKPKPASAGDPKRTQPKRAPGVKGGVKRPPPKKDFHGPGRKPAAAAAKAAPAVKRDRPLGPVSKKTSTPIQQSPPRKPVAVWPRRHTVVSGDTLSGISARYYGTSRSVARILEANTRVKNPRSLKIGDVLMIPAPDRLAAAKGRPAPEAAKPTAAAKPRLATAGADPVRTYRVLAGDSFYSIAKKMYRRPGRWKDIYAANRALVKNDPQRLRPGMMLRIPQ